MEGEAERREGAFLHIGEHAEHIGDADRRDHQRHEEDQPEEIAAANGLGAKQRQAQPERELCSDPAETT